MTAFLYKALKILLTDVLVHFLQIWKKVKGINYICSFSFVQIVT